MTASFWLPVLIIITGAIASVWLRKLTLTAAAIGTLLAACIYAGEGITGICMMAAFFILGVLATAWKFTVKNELGLAEVNRGRRTAGQVIANAGVASIPGLLAACGLMRADTALVITAAAFASATADTLSSELGNVYGKRFYNIITWRRDSRGANGVISLEGTLAGIGGSSVIALIYASGPGAVLHIPLIIIAGTAGNLADSVLGVTLENKKIAGNNAVNFLNTAVAAAIAWSFL